MRPTRSSPGIEASRPQQGSFGRSGTRYPAQGKFGGWPSVDRVGFAGLARRALEPGMAGEPSAERDERRMREASVRRIAPGPRTDRTRRTSEWTAAQPPNEPPTNRRDQ